MIVFGIFAKYTLYLGLWMGGIYLVVYLIKRWKGIGL